MKNPHIHLLLQRATGLTLSPGNVDNAVKRRMKQLGTDDHRRYLAIAAASKEELDALIDLVVVPETWFFRDADAFAAASEFIVKRLAAGQQQVRVLSVPCASGEEPYSVAIALLEAGIAPERVAITGIDVSPQAIRKAVGAVYQRNAFRGRDSGFRERYFRKTDEGYALREDIRRQVRFQCANLLALDEPAGGQAFDIVFCRNLLIYFDEQAQATAIRKLGLLLKDDGMLFSGYAETAAYCRHGYTLAPYAKAFALRKKLAPPPAPPLALPSRRPKPSTRRQPERVPGRAMPPVPARTEASFPSGADDNTGALLEQARRMADRGTAAEARAAYQALLRQAPDSAEAYFMLGLLSEQHDEREAEECLRRAVYLDPDHYEALCHLALLAERRGNAAAARSFRQRAGRVYERQSGERIQ
ncbi:MAG TPA: CheR family methyltransferase [Noviherbaspirillum sp.]|uniref:CheR family methyltransferase n=1 Tax=Noviherbaspirillum sp. TaxID=1926288 RepID=UPI002D4B02CB|nr:CheR family methyltransferase [Noviherbaspirillum sp.]HYD97562.1 CheR family methyltransferase [Noviherbaspirillum sp.]